MRAPSRACLVLEMAEFHAMDTTVRYYEGTASAVELAAAERRVRALTARIECEQAEDEIFAFPRRSRPAVLAPAARRFGSCVLRVAHKYSGIGNSYIVDPDRHVPGNE